VKCPRAVLARSRYPRCSAAWSRADGRLCGPACAHEYLLAFSCKGRYFCPSCHAKRLARWTLWLDETLLAPVPHRQVVLTIPKRLRPYCLYRRALLGDLARLAARIVTAGVRATTGEPDLRVGIIACLQTHGSLAGQLASPSPSRRHRRRLPARRHLRALARLAGIP